MYVQTCMCWCFILGLMHFAGILCTEIKRQSRRVKDGGFIARLIECDFYLGGGTYSNLELSWLFLVRLPNLVDAFTGYLTYLQASPWHIERCCGDWFWCALFELVSRSNVSDIIGYCLWSRRRWKMYTYLRSFAKCPTYVWRLWRISQEPFRCTFVCGLLSFSQAFFTSCLRPRSCTLYACCVSIRFFFLSNIEISRVHHRSMMMIGVSALLCM